ncbi:FAR1-related sequence 5-like protein [Tanacetum coccineum]
MDDSTRHFIDEDQSTLQEVQTEDTPTHDVHDVIEYDEHDLSDVSPYVDSESDNECRRPTPNGRKYWIPDVPLEEKPTEGDVFDNFDEAYNMYLEYSQKARFKAIHGTNCYKLYNFVENHNHPLVDENNLDNLRARRNLDFSDKVFIHRASLSNIGPTKAHRPRDAQMLVDKLNDRKKHVPNFSFEYKTVNDEMSRMFLADETMKCNYIAFGDVVSFDVPHDFCPFTGIDYNQKSVTFGAGLLSDETFHSYTWLLTAFKQAHGKEPLMVVTDQDAALRNAIEFVFPGSHHRLCMWHITQKLPGKICGDAENDSEFKKLFHKLIWNVHIGPEEFKQRWHALIGMYKKKYPKVFIIALRSVLTQKTGLKFVLYDRRTKEMKLLLLMNWMEALRVHVIILDVMDTFVAIYGPCIEETDQLASDIHTTIEYCVNCLRNDTEKLTEFLAKVNELKKNLDNELPLEPQKPNNEDIFQKLLGVTTPNEVVVKVPKGIRNKGCGTGGARFIGPDKEQADDNDTSDHATSDTE